MTCKAKTHIIGFCTLDTLSTMKSELIDRNKLPIAMVVALVLIIIRTSKFSSAVKEQWFMML